MDILECMSSPCEKTKMPASGGHRRLAVAARHLVQGAIASPQSSSVVEPEAAWEDVVYILHSHLTRQHMHHSPCYLSCSQDLRSSGWTEQVQDGWRAAAAAGSVSASGSIGHTPGVVPRYRL